MQNKQLPKKLNNLRKPAMKKLLIITYILFLQLPILGQQKLDGNFFNSPFEGEMVKGLEIYEDENGASTIEFIHQNVDHLNWVKNSSIQPQRNKVYWLKTQLVGSPTFNGEQIFHVAPTLGSEMRSYDYLDVYFSDSEGDYLHQRTGDKIAQKNRPINFWATLFKVDIQISDTVDLFIRMEGADPYFLMSTIQLWKIDHSTLFPRQVNEAWKEGLFYGILSIQCLFFLILFFIEKEWTHLYFSFFAFGLILTIGFVGFNYSRFEPFSSLRGFRIPFFFYGLVICQFGILKFAETYFNYSKTSIFSKYFIPLFLVISILITTGAALPVDIIPIREYFILPAFVVAILSVILLSFLVYLAPAQKNAAKKWFLIAFSPLLLLTVFLCIVIVGNMAGNFFSSDITSVHNIYDLLKLGIVAMLTLLALSIGYRTNLLKAEKASALQKNLADQKRINKAISRFVPNEFLSALGKSSITEVALGDSIEKEVTVFFSDIRNFTSLSEQMTPKENFQFVNAFNNRMGPIIQRNNGFINQYLGDGIMAIFPDSPADTLRAAIEMQQALHNYNQQRIQQGKNSIKVGMGMHTGSLIMGITGDNHRLDATTISDSVNSASRIENLTKHYRSSILLSEVSLKKLDHPEEFHFRYLGQVQVKGKQKLLKIHECFDGDSANIFELKLATLAEFNAGIQNYFKQSFSQAVFDFEKVLQRNPEDKTATLFLHKAKQLKKMGVVENWTGVEMMEKK